MDAKQQSNSTARLLRRATVVEIPFLMISAFFLFTEHRAHYLGVLPFVLLTIAVTAFLRFVTERRKQLANPEAATRSRLGRGGGFHTP